MNLDDNMPLQATSYFYFIILYSQQYHHRDLWNSEVGDILILFNAVVTYIIEKCIFFVFSVRINTFLDS